MSVCPPGGGGGDTGESTVGGRGESAGSPSPVLILDRKLSFSIPFFRSGLGRNYVIRVT